MSKNIRMTDRFVAAPNLQRAKVMADVQLPVGRIPLTTRFFCRRTQINPPGEKRRL